VRIGVICALCHANCYICRHTSTLACSFRWLSCQPGRPNRSPCTKEWSADWGQIVYSIVGTNDCILNPGVTNPMRSLTSAIRKGGKSKNPVTFAPAVIQRWSELELERGSTFNDDGRGIGRGNRSPVRQANSLSPAATTTAAVASTGGNGGLSEATSEPPSLIFHPQLLSSVLGSKSLWNPVVLS
jgi:hypothetical protein